MEDDKALTAVVMFEAADDAKVAAELISWPFKNVLDRHNDDDGFVLHDSDDIRTIFCPLLTPTRSFGVMIHFWLRGRMGLCLD